MYQQITIIGHLGGDIDAFRALVREQQQANETKT